MNAYNSQVKLHVDYRSVVRVNYGKSFQVALRSGPIITIAISVNSSEHWGAQTIRIESCVP